MTWVTRELPWHRTEVLYCDVTGQLLPRRYWQFEADGRILKARDPHCEELYRRYLAPPEGGIARSAGADGIAGRDVEEAYDIGVDLGDDGVARIKS